MKHPTTSYLVKCAILGAGGLALFACAAPVGGDVREGDLGGGVGAKSVTGPSLSEITNDGTNAAGDVWGDDDASPPGCSADDPTCGSTGDDDAGDFNPDPLPR